MEWSCYNNSILRQLLRDEMETHKDAIKGKFPDPQKVIRKDYEKPRLDALGDIRATTLGGSINEFLESGNKSKKQP